MSNTPAVRDHQVRDMTIPDPQGTGNAASAELVAWAEGLAAAHRIASALCVTSFAPSHFRGKPEESAAAIMYGAEVGFTPTQSLQNLYSISGKPALYARAMVALVQAAGHEVWTEEKTDESVTVCGRRRGTDRVTTETWTTARAQRAGYTTNKKYQTDPQAMLYARAASDVCRQIAADTLAGIGHTVEELQIIEPEQAAPVNQSRGLGAVRAAVQRDPEPQADPDTGEVQDAPVMASDAQRRAMFAAFGGNYPNARTTEGREMRLAYLTQVLGREVKSSNDLTADECSRVIDALHAEAQNVPADERAPWDQETGEVTDQQGGGESA